MGQVGWSATSHRQVEGENAVWGGINVQFQYQTRRVADGMEKP